MFYTAVFLAGEWAKSDFTWAGKILCLILCVMGIALFAIPVGTVFEAFQDVLQEVNGGEEEEDAGPDEKPLERATMVAGPVLGEEKQSAVAGEMNRLFPRSALPPRKVPQAPVGWL